MNSGDSGLNNGALLGSLNMLVHGDLNWLLAVRRSARFPLADRSKLDTLLY